jgi:hypothetical protein
MLVFIILLTIPAFHVRVAHSSPSVGLPQVATRSASVATSDQKAQRRANQSSTTVLIAVNETDASRPIKRLAPEKVDSTTPERPSLHLKISPSGEVSIDSPIETSN